MNRPQRALAVTLVVALGLAAGFISYRLQSLAPLPPARSALPAPSNGGPAVIQPQSTDGSDEAPPPPVPDSLPDLTLPDLSGKPRSLRSFGSRPLIVNFWATWCAPCRREIPLLRDLRQRYRADRLEVVGIAVDFAAAVRDYLRQTPIDYPVLIGEQDGLAAAEQFGMRTVLPFSVFVDAQGRIVALKVGELHVEEADFILGEIHSLDRGQVSLKDARARIDAQLRELAIDRAKAQQNKG
ncbi:MAG TPA: TlpA disulfide reductase family protein [Steroidobacteraceae bacterium]